MCHQGPSILHEDGVFVTLSGEFTVTLLFICFYSFIV